MKLNLEVLDNLPYTEMVFSDIESIVDARFVKETRKKLNFNQALFAKLIHVSKKTVEAWEQGKNPVGGGNAIIVFLINKDPSVATKLLKVIPHNGASVSAKYEMFLSEEDSTGYVLDGVWTPVDNKRREGGMKQWMQKYQQKRQA